ncbi:MAG: hypothetical protein MZW92_61105 [Comamonadaceae bacterium]|nr:hypothetical protein [Comamonadaceae bacterium]
MRTRKILFFILACAAVLALAPPSPAQKASDPGLQGQARFQPLARRRRALRRHEDAPGRLPQVPQARVDRQEPRRPRPHADDGQQPGHGARDRARPAMYIEANIHGNEIQGGEVCLYTIWYLMENYGRIDDVTRLVDERVFYIIPTVNPDGRQYFMEGPGGNARSGHVPVDDDNDGLFDEDAPGGRQRQRHRRADPQVRARAGQLPDQPGRTRTPSSPCPTARRATTSCSARRASTTTATAWSTRTGRAATTATATGRATGSRATSRAGPWTIPSSSPRPRRSTIS